MDGDLRSCAFADLAGYLVEYVEWADVGFAAPV